MRIKRNVVICSLVNIFIALTVSSAVYPQSASIIVGGQSKKTAKIHFRKGKIAALKALKKGQLVYRTYGLIGPDSFYFRSIMESEYGVKIDWVAGCIVSSGVAAQTDGYNSVMLPQIEKRYGKEIWKEAHERAYAASQHTAPAPELPPLIPGIPSPIEQLDKNDDPPPPPKKNS